eukprot:521805_1
MAQLASATHYIHSCGVTHRDLKPENILLTSKEKNASIMVSDFGLSKIAEESDKPMDTICGTWAYCAPEVIKREPYTPVVDNWSLGILMFILLSGYHPFDVYGELGEAQLMRRIIRCKFDFDDNVWKDVSKEAKQLIKSLLEVDPKKRLGLGEFLETPWIKGKEITAVKRPDVIKNME